MGSLMLLGQRETDFLASLLESKVIFYLLLFFSLKDMNQDDLTGGQEERKIVLLVKI